MSSRNQAVGRKPIVCDICQKSLANKRNLKAHILVVHENAGRFKCGRCDKTFHCKTNLKYHENTHTGERPFVCKICNKGFKTKTNLGLHKLNVHEEGRPFECKECPQRFASDFGLKQHHSIYHKEKKVQCDQCGRGFARKANLKVHLRRMHIKNRDELDEQPEESHGSGEANYSLMARSKPTNHREGQDLDESDESDSSRSSDESEESDKETDREEAVQPGRHSKLKKIKTENLVNDEPVPDLDDPMEGSSRGIKREFEDVESSDESGNEDGNESEKSDKETDRKDEAVEEGGWKRIKRESDSNGQTEDTEPDYYDFDELVAVNQRRMKKEENEMITLGSDESDQESESPQESSITVTNANLKLVFDVEYRAPE